MGICTCMVVLSLSLFLFLSHSVSLSLSLSLSLRDIPQMENEFPLSGSGQELWHKADRGRGGWVEQGRGASGGALERCAATNRTIEKNPRRKPTQNAVRYTATGADKCSALCCWNIQYYSEDFCFSASPALSVQTDKQSAKWTSMCAEHHFHRRQTWIFHKGVVVPVTGSRKN